MRRIGRRLLAAALGCSLLFAGMPAVGAVSTSTSHLVLTLDETEALLDEQPVALDSAGATYVGGRMMVPLKFVGDTLGVPVKWNAKTGNVEMAVPKAKLQFDLANQKVSINGVTVPFENVAALVGEKLMVRLSWLADYAGFDYTYDDQNKRVNIVFVPIPADLINDETNNSQPVAKFTFGKAVYRPGETIKYVDLSYDPDAEGLAKYEWTGRQDVYFKPGSYPISLKVTDASGNVSKTYTRTLVVAGTPLLDEMSYKLHNQPVGTAIDTDWTALYAYFLNRPDVPKKVTEDTSRKLILSDSPENIKEKGILYRDSVNGKARLYADHINATEDILRFAIVARNKSDKPVTVRTTNKGEVYPSIYAHLIGHEASVDFMLRDPIDTKLVVPAGQSYVYVQLPDFYPGQGVNLFYDVETDGEVEFAFVAMNNRDTVASIAGYKDLPFAGNVRGTFPVSDVTWSVDLSAAGLSGPSVLTIGDGKIDPFLPGYDRERQQEVRNEGNYGVMYHIHSEKPRKMVVLMLARGGAFKGPFKINGDFVMAPWSGVLPAFTKVQVLGRTTGEEATFDLEFTPPAGSAFPIDLIFYPLD
ncbi:hypothetical protein J31TS4_35440 [Paenibacillus sp. J31TS4]|uniref:stalk domain-containing protein n=1 Tax=Paenibacillus sp. J31TS4 TaxID=2807195 RepID=UPI001B1F0836|nr:stalk domain-containing protein [Paenibacillus sp. J31TS4]GIP40264.1 hypothetical protein J31TS4_35440 [Paenibacillus sp. J31TS4]